VLPFFFFPPPNALDNIFDIFFERLPLPLEAFIDAVVSNNDAFKSFAKSARPNWMLLRFLFFDLLDCFEMDDNREAEFDSCDRRISRKREREREEQFVREIGREREREKKKATRRLRVAKDKKTNPPKIETHSLKT
jgi:hypothetical protein